MARYAEAIEANLAFSEHAPSHLLLSVGGAAYAGNGNREEGSDELPPMAAFLNVDSSFAPLRRDHRFGAGLVPVFETNS